MARLHWRHVETMSAAKAATFVLQRCICISTPACSMAEAICVSVGARYAWGST